MAGESGIWSGGIGEALRLQMLCVVVVRRHNVDIITYWSVPSQILAVGDVSVVFCSGSDAFSHWYRIDDFSDTNGPVTVWSELLITVGAMMRHRLNDNVLRVSVTRRFFCCDGGREMFSVAARLVRGACSCNDESCGLDLVM